MNQQKSGTYHYQKVTTTSRTVREPNQNKYSSQKRTVTTTNSRTVNKPKITVNELKTNSTQIPRCNKCGKLKCAANQKQIINEQGSWSRKTESLNKYDKYNKAAYANCAKCGKTRAQCKCHRSTSVTTTVSKRSLNAGNVDLTPKVKINLNPEKIRKAVEEQKRIAEEEKRKKESRTHKVEQKAKAVSREENYTYNKKIERTIRDEDICHCGDENCKKNEENLMRKKKEEEQRHAKLMEEQRLKRLEEEKRRKLEAERKKKLEEERLRLERERKRRLEEEKRIKEEEEIQKRTVEALQFKDIPLKTFYTEYIQKKYKYAEVPFPERSSYTIHITSDMTNVNNSENILVQNAQTQSYRSENMLCPGCGRMTFCQNKSNMQSSKVEQNIASAQQGECICPNCKNNEVEVA
jgi:hypothetical protein